MSKPRLVVMEANTATILQHEKQLNHKLKDKATVEVVGHAADLTVEEYLGYYILGKRETPKTEKRKPRDPCDIYVGIRHEQDLDGLAEKGYELAKENGIPVHIMDGYSAPSICEFVNQCLQ